LKNPELCLGFFVSVEPKHMVDGEQNVSFHGQTMEKEQVHFKYGVYRSFLSSYKEAHNEDNLLTQAVY